MTASPADSQESDFIKSLEKSLGAPVENSQNIVSFAGNSAEIFGDRDLEKSDFEKLISSCELRGMPLLRGAAQIFRKEFFSFLRVNFVVTVSFLLSLFATLLWCGSTIQSYSSKFLNHLPFLNYFGLSNALSLTILLLFWIFFSHLRSAYLAVVSNYFCPSEHFKPLRFGLKKIFSFILIEFMQIVMFLMGLILVFLAPFFGTKYFLSLPVMMNQNEGAVNSMFDSKEYTRGQMAATMRCMFFISIFTISVITSCLLITNLFINNNLIFWAVNFLLFSFLFLPLHSCYRFLIYKKLQHLTGEMKFKIEFGEKLWFVASRLAFLLLLSINIFLAAIGAFDDELRGVFIELKNSIKILRDLI